MATDGQLGCLARLESTAHVDRFVWHDQCETPRAISGVLAPNDGTDAADAAAGFLTNYGELFELSGAKTWERVQGLIAGTVDGRSGKFEGELRVTGGQLAEGKGAAFGVKGVMAVIGVFTFVVVSDGAPEGVDLGVPVIGDLGELRRRLRSGPTAPEEHEAEKLP